MGKILQKCQAKVVEMSGCRECLCLVYHKTNATETQLISIRKFYRKTHNERSASNPNYKYLFIGCNSFGNLFI